jgi:serine/threonine protein kinase
MAIFNDNPSTKKPKLRLGYGTLNKARKSVKLLRKEPRQYQMQAAHTLYYRAKYHKYQTKGMKNAEKVYGNFIKTLKRKTLKKKKGGKFLAKGAQGYVFMPPLKSKCDKDDFVSKLTTKSVAEAEKKIGDLMKQKMGDIDDYVIYPLEICEVAELDKQSDENKAILEKIPAKFGYNTLIIMQNGGRSLKDIMEDLRDSLRSNRNEYKKYDNTYLRDLFISLCKLGKFLASMNESGYFHNDIKADNIVYNEKENKARFIDLGISGQEKLKTSMSKKVISDTCYFMFVMTELLDTIEYKYRIKERLILKFKYDSEKCYENEYDDFRDDIDNMEKYVISAINKS